MVGSRVNSFFLTYEALDTDYVLWDINNVTIHYALYIEKCILYYVISLRLGWYEFRKPQRGNPRIGSHCVKLKVSVLKTLMVYTICCFKQTLYMLMTNMIHLFNGCEWNSCFIQSALFPRGLARGESFLSRVQLKTFSTHNQWISVLFYWFLLWFSMHDNHTVFLTLWNVELFSVTDALIMLKIPLINQFAEK